MLKCFSRSGTFFVTAQLSYSTGQFLGEINVLGGWGFFWLVCKPGSFGPGVPPVLIKQVKLKTEAHSPRNKKIGNLGKSQYWAWIRL